ncbi:GntR family transcriptional regulator [Ensifer adhaerens]|uniref:GntR family transcriptional regulator n=1 Tax=Ensifer adhaerens TaxID=106592 RepID=A0A9Q9DEG7_ENSAD|nr:GntR family transcriptional regulator [Ensifer adhaerens]USJ28406.1 GntR family transcriptional regulator [Ensifer adhaerens]
MNQHSLLASSHQPKLYLKLADAIRQQIMDGAFAANQMLPSETDMVTKYGVSRITVRQAIAVLVEENLVKRIQGKGSFVKEMNFRQNTLGSHDLLLDQDERDGRQSFRVFDYELKAPPKHFRNIFMLSEGAKVHSFRRIKYSENVPVMLENLLLPEAYFPDLDKKGIETRWIAKILNEDYGVQLKRMRKTLQPIVIGSREARHLSVAPRSVGLLVDRITWDGDEHSAPVLITRSIVRGEHAKFYVDIKYEEANGES